MTISRCTRNAYHVRRGSGQAACRPPAARRPFRADLTLAPEGAAEPRTDSVMWRTTSSTCATGIGPNSASRAANKASNGKPFVYEELLARINAVLRRASRPRSEQLEVRGLRIDLSSRSVRVDERAVELSAKEYELLVALAEEPERVFRKEDLLKDVWQFRSLGRTRTLDSHASRLRRKLNAPGESTFVLNVWGVGYRLVATAA